MGLIKSIVLFLAGAALALFLWSNYDTPVQVRFTDLAVSRSIPLSAALVIALTAGFLLAFLLSLPNQFRLRGRLREQRRTIERLESELSELRKLPLEDVSDKLPPSAGASTSTEAAAKPNAT